MKKLNKKVVNILKKKRFRLSIAESCTGGMLSSCITSVSGSSKVFILGLVTYSNLSTNQIIKKYGAVSYNCCLSMLNNLSKISKANISISITGIAGPKGGSKLKPVGLVYIGVKNGNKVKINKFIFKNNGRNKIQKAATRKSLELVLASLK